MDYWKQIFIYGRIRTNRGTGNLQQICYTAVRNVNKKVWINLRSRYECNHVYENRGLKEYSTNCKTYEETCIYCGHNNQTFESSTPINHNSHQKYCKNCGDEIKKGQKIESVMKTGITNGVVSKRSRKGIVNTTSACSNCDEDFCNSCLTYQRDKYSHEDLYLCSSCLREYKKTLAEKQNAQSKKERFSAQNAFGTKRESTKSRKNPLYPIVK
ncbi:hypothetical protein Mpsy_1072 [Methanolobus psychrophilus R15]|nr:hypothetical protein Mpsy_1072 [Methanolobus psychrophilus R15]